MVGVSTLAEPSGFTPEDLPRLRYGPGQYELVDGSLHVTGGGFTSDSLDELPDDGYRHEVIDGELIVTPSPSLSHQRMVLCLGTLLDEHCPADQMVLIAPFDVRLSDLTTVEPDILVARRADLTERNLPTAPVLAVEILSRTTRHLDLGRKKTAYTAAGCPHYWVVHPYDLTLTAWERRDGEYAEVADVTGRESWTAESPFPVTITPADLLR
jgi:Uma2 family endonuclease